MISRKIVTKPFGEFRRHLRHLTGMSVRADDVGGLLDTFIILGILTIVVVRILLWLTGYPQLAGKSLHIAHMLWGGLLMVAALILMQSIILRWARRTGAVLGGVGFGLFIDELGKFITRDNNYFFRPTVALIYILFILIYFSTRYLLRVSRFTSQESLVNAIDYLKEAGVGELDEKDKRRAGEHLFHVPDSNPFKEPLTRLLGEVQALPSRAPYFWERWGSAFSRFYRRLVSRPFFSKFVAVFFLALALLKLSDVGITFHALLHWQSLSLLEATMLTSSLVTLVFFLIGDWFLLRGRRLIAYRWLERGLIVAILIGQVFVFVRVQLKGILWLIVLLLLYAALRIMMNQETRIRSS
jgi:hypothetical protein